MDREAYSEAKVLPLFKIDLHVHTDYSDSSSTIDDILDAARGRGLDGIAIVDLDQIISFRLQVVSDWPHDGVPPWQFMFYWP